MEYPQRKPTRLPEFDYAVGTYFVTICTYDRKCILSDVVVGALHEAPETRLTRYGEIADEMINQLPNRFGVRIGHYVVMPNHIHLLLHIENEENGRALREAPLQQARSPLAKIVGFLKMNVSKEIHKIDPSLSVWQRSFYEHVIRGDTDYREIWEYIENNPAKWAEDRYYLK